MSFSTPQQFDTVPTDVKGAVILVVDGERAWRVILETDLRMLGYNPLLAADKTEALNQCLGNDPDVVIVDPMLPDSWRLLSELRVRGKSIPTIFYSAYPMDRAEHHHPDVVGCVSKATGTASLCALLPTTIRTKRSHQRLHGSVPPAFPPEP